MKKLFYMISAVALMASSASCNKIEQENTPAETPSVEGTVDITISAGITQSKTYYNGATVKWMNNDEVMLLAQGASAKTKAVLTSASDVCDFTFTGWPTDIQPEYLVFNGPLATEESPYGTGNRVEPTILDNNGYIVAELRSNQKLENKNANSKYSSLSIGQIDNGENSIYTTEMKNVCGLIKFQFANDQTVANSVTIENLGDAYMAGLVKVDYNDGNPCVKEVVEGKKSVTLTYKSETMGKSVYYACVLPGTYTPKITINLAEGEPIVLTAKDNATITVNRNEIFSFGVIDNVTSDEGGDDDPVVPTETKTITLDFGTAWPLSPALDKYNSTEKKPQIKEKTTYTLTQDDATYSFEVYSTGAGFYNTGTALRLSNASGTSGYITTPAISGFKLTGADVTITNSSGSKNLTLYSNCTISDGVITASGEMEKIEINTTTTKNGTSTFSETAENTSYYLHTTSTNYQLGKLILTYTKVN